MAAQIKPKNKLEALSINEEVGNIPTHFMKSGSSMRPSADLEALNKFKKELIPERHRDVPFEYDIWFNTNELMTIRKWLYTDFMGKGLYFRVPTVQINDKLFKNIIDSDIKIDEERIQKIIDNLHNKYHLQYNSKFYDKIVFLPGSNLLCKPVVDWNKLKTLVEDGWVIKPHPITAHLWMAHLRRFFGKKNVLGKKQGGFELLLNCKEIATCQNSEMGLIALLLNKDIRMVSFPKVQREKNLLTYESFYTTLAGTNAKKGILKLFSAKNSGLIFAFDNDAKDRLDRYLGNFWEYKVFNG